MIDRRENLRRFYTIGGVPFWRDVRVLQAMLQMVSAVVVVGFIVFAIQNFLSAADARGLSLKYDFLDIEAGFPIGESPVPYDPSQTFAYALFVGLINTLQVALTGVVLATVVGIFIGVARLSSNWLVRQMAGAYIELIRNIPLLVQLFIWYFAIFQKLPRVAQAVELPGPIYLSNRGVDMLWFTPTETYPAWIILTLIGVALAIALWRILSGIQERSGRARYPLLSSFAVFLLFPTAGWFLVGQAPLVKDVPVLQGFNFQGGLTLSPEFSALLIGLVVYTSSFIAEIVRAGIQAVQRGQTEAANALGLTHVQTLRLVIFPQALRVIIPPLISQYLNLTKNSSLAIAIGYPDLFFVGRTIINQSGRAVPAFGLMMAVYLALSLTYALIGNVYNRRVRLVER
jgi:general L-amino acid transport system permease protein